MGEFIKMSSDGEAGPEDHRKTINPLQPTTERLYAAIAGWGRWVRLTTARQASGAITTLTNNVLGQASRQLLLNVITIEMPPDKNKLVSRGSVPFFTVNGKAWAA